MDQLQNDQHVMCRVDAIESLAAFPGAKDDDVAAALIHALGTDNFWGVRQTAAKSLAKLNGGKVRDALIEAAQHDAKAQVRREAIKSLPGFAHEATRAALRSIITQDQSYFAIAEALKTLVKVDRSGCRAELLAALRTPSQQEVILKAACDGLVELKDRASGDEIASLLDQSNSALRRTVLIGALARLKTDDPKVVERLDKQLDNRRASVRQATIESLVALGDPRAIDVLQARRDKEEDSSRLLRALDEGITTLRAKELDFEKLKTEIESLRSENRKLDERLKKLEDVQKK